MGRLTYNPDIFTNVKKWDSEYTYLGVFISGKLNQKNGSGYPILDVIDLDWDGAFLTYLNTYLYTTEDVIRVLDIYGNDHNYLKNDVVNNSYLSYVLGNIDKNITYQISNNNEYISDVIIDGIFQRIEVLDQIRDVVLDDTRYIRLQHNEVFDENNNLLYPDQEYYVYVDRQYVKVSNEYILTHPEETYYEFILQDIININKRIWSIQEKIGEEVLDEVTNQYTYSGFYERFHNIEVNIDDLSYLTSYSIDLGSEAYSTAYETKLDIDNSIRPTTFAAYTNSYLNTEKIGHHTIYNVYEKIEEYTPEIMDYIHEHNNTVFTYNQNTGEYTASTYNSHYQGQYYVFYEKIAATGIEKEIEDINQNIGDNTYLLYHLTTESKDPDNIQLKMTPNDRSTIDRKITVDITKSLVNENTGTITEGLITYTNLINSFSYMFNWKILKNE
jgi:hypothetical protein